LYKNAIIITKFNITKHNHHPVTRDGRISDPAIWICWDFHYPTKSNYGPDCMFHAGQIGANYCMNISQCLPMQPVDCVTDVELTVCALLKPAKQWPMLSSEYTEVKFPKWKLHRNTQWGICQ